MAKQTNSRPRARAAAPRFQFEYVTSAVSLLMFGAQGDGIVVHVLNDHAVAARTQVVIYINTGAGAVVMADSGVVDVVPSWTWGLGYTLNQSGEYWVRIRASSEFLVPKVAFERVRDGIWVPVTSYRPGDFAVFRLSPARRRIW
jgi:hypothetical protein